MRTFVFIFFLFPLGIFAQNNIIYSEKDSLNLKKIKVKDTVHSPKKAALLSILPGAGQIYNSIAMPKGKKHAYWKVPLIYAGLGVTAYFFLKNNRKQRMLKKEYLYRTEYGAPNLAEYAQYDNQGILTQFEAARRNRDLMIFAFIAVYGLNILDAYVTAHFINFDISKDLSLSIRPKLLNLQTIGVGFTFSLH